MNLKNIYYRLLSLFLMLSIVLTQVSCSSAPPNASITVPGEEQILVENIEVENTITEEILTEHITEEIYLEEIILAEDKITELLLEEETINEVILCRTIYIPQENLEEFAENSQTSSLFGDEVDLKPVLKKVAVGTGVILTVVVLKKVGFPDPIASVVCAAADESLMFAEGGAVVGSLYGGLSGASGAIDESGRTSAVIAFATATAGLVISIVSLVGEIPSGGASSITLATGVKLVIAGVSVGLASAGTVYSGYQAVKTFQATDGVDIDWDNIDWDAVGEQAALNAVNYGADGYMWGSIIGVVHGGADGYDYYHKFNAPYSTLEKRYAQTPKDGNRGKWTGKRGESDFVLDEPIVLKDGTEVTKITYRNGIPDFSEYQLAQVKIPNMTNNRTNNFNQADEILAEIWTRTRVDNKTWSAADIKQYRKDNNLVWHEMNNMESMQLVPFEVNDTFGHLGGVGEYNTMIGQEGVDGYD